MFLNLRIRLQIDNETLFVDMSKVLEAAICWEERAAHILSTKATMPEFEDIIRSLLGSSFFVYAFFLAS